MNYFDNLSDDIKNTIFLIRDNYSANKIINAWYRYINRKIIATQLLINYVIYAPYTIPYINVFNNRTLQILKYCNKVLSGRENIWWAQQFKTLQNFTIEHNNYGFGNDAINFNKIAIELDKLKQKFNW